MTDPFESGSSALDLGQLRLGISHYQLQPRSGSAARHGFLIRAENQETGAVGFSDCHPWPEFGDETVAGQEAALKSGHLTPLLQASLAVAQLDGEHRRQHRSLTDGLDPIENHYSAGHLAESSLEAVLDEAVRLGFQTVKVKVSPGLSARPDWVKNLARMCASRRLMLRADFNARADEGLICRFLEAWKEAAELSSIDWLEDPCPYSEEVWKGLRDRFPVHLALDFEGDKWKPGQGGFDAAVIKPVRPLLLPLEAWGVPICFTSALDHPLGQVYAHCFAAKCASQFPLVQGGLASHLAYEPNAYSERLAVPDGCLLTPAGWGLGFDDLLENEHWEYLYR